MRQAFVFTCDECGRDCFVPVFSKTMPDEELEQIRESFQHKFQDLKVMVDPEYTSYPATVTCDKCGAKFDAEYPDLFDTTD